MAVINGTIFSDILTGTADSDVIFGGFGDDLIGGGAGNDTLFGKTGQWRSRSSLALINQLTDGVSIMTHTSLALCMSARCF